VSNAKIADNVPDVIGNNKTTKHHNNDLHIDNTLCFIINFLFY